MRGRFRVSFLCCYRNGNNGSVGAMTRSEEYFGKSPVTVAYRLWLCLYKAELFKWNCQYLYGSCGENFVLSVCCYNKFLPLWSKISICSVMSANSLVTDFFWIFFKWIHDREIKAYLWRENTAWLYGGIPVHVNTSVKDRRLYRAVVVNSDVIPDVSAI